MPICGAQGSMSLEVPWWGLVRATLGDDAKPSSCGVVFSRPGRLPFVLACGVEIHL